MSGGLRLLTAMLLLVPILFLVRSAFVPPPARQILLFVGALTAALCAFIWLYMRPTGFDVDPGFLRIVWPLRIRAIPRAEITGVEVVTGRAFRERYGSGIRIGVGGLWGGFGLLQGERETFSMWISRRDVMVLVRLAQGARPLLLTPVDPERFASALQT
jgi:hypothetical protein